MKKIFIYILLIIPNTFIAQQKKDSVKTEVIEVTRSYTPTVQDAYKLAVNPDSIQVVEKKIPVEYKIQSVPVASTFQPEKGRMSQFQFQPNFDKNFNSYARIAFGNYTYLNADAFLSYPVNEKIDAGFRFSHRSSQGDKDNNLTNPYYRTQVNALMSFTQDNSHWNMDLGYLSNIHHLSPNLFIITPSFPIPEEVLYSEKRSQNVFNFNIKGKFKDLIIKDIRMNFQNFWDPYKNNENVLNFNTNLSFPISEIQIQTGIKADLVSGTAYEKYYNGIFKKNYKNLSSGILPSFNYTNDNLDVKIGFKLFYQNSDADYNKVQFFPDILANFNIVYEKLSLYGALNGDINQTSYIRLFNQNPYVVPMKILPELMPMEIYGGIKGAFSSSFSYNIKMGYRQLKNHPFYMISPTVFNFVPYSVVYDELKQSFFGADLNAGIGKRLDFKVNFIYYQNNPESLPKAYYMSDYVLKSLILFHPTEKIDINLSMYNYSNRPDNFGSSLAGFTDLNLEFKYKINKNFSTFIQANNILNNPYEIYLAYPVEKIQFLGGLLYKFDFSNKNN